MLPTIKKRNISLLAILFAQGLMAASLATDKWKLVLAFIGFLFITVAVNQIRKDGSKSAEVFVQIPKAAIIVICTILVLLMCLSLIRFFM